MFVKLLCCLDVGIFFLNSVVISLFLNKTSDFLLKLAHLGYYVNEILYLI